MHFIFLTVVFVNIPCFSQVYMYITVIMLHHDSIKKSKSLFCLCSYF